SMLQRIAALANSAQEAARADELHVSEVPTIGETVLGGVLLPASEQTPASVPDASTESFEELRAKVLVCTKCPNLVAFRHSVVFGFGNPKADLMFVGEAPGADEDRQGEPVCGR